MNECQASVGARRKSMRRKQPLSFAACSLARGQHVRRYFLKMERLDSEIRQDLRVTAIIRPIPGGISETTWHILEQTFRSAMPPGSQSFRLTARNSQIRTSSFECMSRKITLRLRW